MALRPHAAPLLVYLVSLCHANAPPLSKLGLFVAEPKHLSYHTQAPMHSPTTLTLCTGSTGPELLPLGPPPMSDNIQPHSVHRTDWTRDKHRPAHQPCQTNKILPSWVDYSPPPMRYRPPTVLPSEYECNVVSYGLWPAGVHRLLPRTVGTGTYRQPPCAANRSRV
jgi:hypothetical protein